MTTTNRSRRTEAAGFAERHRLVATILTLLLVVGAAVAAGEALGLILVRVASSLLSVVSGGS